MLIGAIVVCEVAFWVLLVGGLFARYLLRRPRLGLALVLASPAVDLGLLALTAVDLHRGAVATQVHALAAVYLGFSVAFGPNIVEWADRRFAYHFSGGPPPVKQARRGPARVAHEWREFRKAALAWVVSGALLAVLAVLTGDVQRATALLGYIAVMSLVLIIWFFTGPVPATAQARRRAESRS